jgi:hypothetical protein
MSAEAGAATSTASAAPESAAIFRPIRIIFLLSYALPMPADLTICTRIAFPSSLWSGYDCRMNDRMKVWFPGVTFWHMETGFPSDRVVNGALEMFA